MTGSAIGNAASAMLLGVVTARLLGPVGQGTLTLVTTTSAMTVLALSAGTGISLRVRSAPVPDPTDVRAFLGLSLGLMPLSGLVTMAAAWLLAARVVGLGALVAIFAYGAAALLSRQASDLVQAYGRTSASILSIGVGFLVQAVAFGALAGLGHRSVAGALACGVLGAVAQCLFSWACIRAFRPALLATWRLERWLALIRQGAPTVGYGLGLLAMQRLDRLLLVPLAGPRAGGVYAVAATVAEAARITSSAVGQLLFVRTAGSRGVTREVRHLYQLAVVLQLLIIGVLELLAPWVVGQVFGADYLPAVPLLRGLLVAELFMGLALMDSRIVMGLGRLREVGAVTLASTSLAVAVYAVLIHAGGAAGAVQASVATYAVYATLLLWQRTRAARTAERKPLNV